jgi:hypothetical protein
MRWRGGSEGADGQTHRKWGAPDRVLEPVQQAAELFPLLLVFDQVVHRGS